MRLQLLLAARLFPYGIGSELTPRTQSLLGGKLRLYQIHSATLESGVLDAGAWVVLQVHAYMLNRVRVRVRVLGTQIYSVCSHARMCGCVRVRARHSRGCQWGVRPRAGAGSRASAGHAVAMIQAAAAPSQHRRLLLPHAWNLPPLHADVYDCS